MKPIKVALDRAALWLDFARCYRQEAARSRNPDYWLARAARAEQTAAA